MDALKIVPQAFFDAIARVLPGLFTIFLLAWFEPSAWGEVAAALARMHGSKSEVWPVLSLLVVAYAVGHLLTPGTKLVQRVTDRYPRIRPKSKNGDHRTTRSVLGDLWASWTSLNTKPETASLKPNSVRYDWLRHKAPDVGGHAAKLRAEFTMYNSLAFVFIVFAAWFCASSRALSHAPIFFALGLLMAARGRETQKTMRDCVENFYAAAEGPHPWPAVPGEDA